MFDQWDSKNSLFLKKSKILNQDQIMGQFDEDLPGPFLFSKSKYSNFQFDFQKHFKYQQ